MTRLKCLNLAIGVSLSWNLIDKLFLYLHVQVHDDNADHDYSNEVHGEDEEEPERKEKHEFEHTSEILESVFFLVHIFFHFQVEAGIERLETELEHANGKLDQILLANGISYERTQRQRHGTWEDILRKMAVIGDKLVKMFVRHRNYLND